jgi:hypothetical protein
MRLYCPQCCNNGVYCGLILYVHVKASQGSNAGRKGRPQCRGGSYRFITTGRFPDHSRTFADWVCQTSAPCHRVSASMQGIAAFRVFESSAPGHDGVFAANGIIAAYQGLDRVNGACPAVGRRFFFQERTGLGQFLGSRYNPYAIIPPRCAPAPPLPHRRGKCAARCSLAWRTGSGPASFPGRSIPEPRPGLCPPAGRWPDGWRTRSWSPCSEGVSLTVFPSGRQRPLANTLSA